MITSIRHETPRARKRHVCDLCGATIPIGMCYYKNTCVCDGQIIVSSVHKICAYVSQKLKIGDECGELTSDLFMSTVDDFLEEQGIEYAGKPNDWRVKTIFIIFMDALEAEEERKETK